jgi:argininosuccinate lyase
MKVVLQRTESGRAVIIPAFTHLQMAQPVLLSHYLLGLFFMLERDFNRLSKCFEAADIMPLGSGALAGAGFNLDRAFLARALGFKKISDNSIDAVADRDYIIEFLSACSILSMHLSRYAEDFIIFSSPGYGYMELSDAFATGSSMMPNKKNPDSLELVRGKTGRIFGNLMSLLSVLKGLPLTYNKDLQEDKEALFDTVDTIKDCIQVFAGVLATLQINKHQINVSLLGDLLATDLADLLVEQGMPFRDAHKVVARIVLDCQKRKMALHCLSALDLKKYSTRFPDNIKLGFKESIKRRSLDGGTGLASVNRQIRKAKSILARIKA